LLLTDYAALVHVMATVVAIGFQVALAAGAPWGALAMGGRYPGRLPPAMRALAIVQALILLLLALIVLDAAGLAELGWTSAVPWLPWLPVVFAGLSVAVNGISPSIRERRLWVPVGVVLLVSSGVVAVTG
jgi:hypothetical protein